MNKRSIALFGAAAIGVATVASWTPRPQAAGAESPKTAWGDPDLQGIWSQHYQTPLQRPARDAARALLTSDEVKQRVVQGNAPPGPLHLFRLDITELVLISLGGDPPDHMLIEAWHPGRGITTLKR